MAISKNKKIFNQEITIDKLMELLKKQDIITSENNKLYITRSGKFFFEEEIFNEHNLISNAYLEGRREWDERHGTIIAQNSLLWKYLFGLIGLCALLTIGLISVAHQSKVVPLIVAQDKLGVLTSIGVPQPVKLNQAVVGQQIMQYITALRSFSSDSNVNNRNITIVTSMSSQSISSQIDEMIKANAGDSNLSSITVQPTSIIALQNSNSYELDWTETRRMTDGTTTETSWQGIITFTKIDLDSLTTLMNNPLGILVTQMQISQKLVNSQQAGA